LFILCNNILYICSTSTGPYAFSNEQLIFVILLVEIVLVAFTASSAFIFTESFSSLVCTCSLSCPASLTIACVTISCVVSSLVILVTKNDATDIYFKKLIKLQNSITYLYQINIFLKYYIYRFYIYIICIYNGINVDFKNFTFLSSIFDNCLCYNFFCSLFTGYISN